MSTRKHAPRSRGFRPEADDLESRQLLSAVVSGTDSKGDTWTLKLIGPGQLNVSKQNISGSPSGLTSASDIKTITVAGTNPVISRVVGTVTPGKGSDGRVFFDSLVQIPSRSVKYPGSGNGLVSINIPNFWLGNTTPFGATPTAAPNISVPDGVDTFNFGGVDASFKEAKPTGSTATAVTPTNDTALVSLGLPTFGGTRIIIDKSISSTDSVPPTTGTTPTIIQHAVLFGVSGRLNLFQANEIDGDRKNPSGQFKDFSPTATGNGGTVVISTAPGFGGSFSFTSSLFPNNETKGAVTGQIGDVRIGGNATNFATYVFDPTGSGGDKISNFSVGGETTNVLLVAPNGSRNVVFGKGMDTVDIISHVIDTLQANRGALNSNVYVDRSISRADFGGPVVNTRVLAGYQQGYTSVLAAVIGNPSFSQSPTSPPTPLNAQPSGGLTVHVAGNVTNSIFAASVQPANNDFTKFGDPNQIVLTGGHITSKIEGTISNPTIAPNTPNKAVFAESAKTYTGPVIPPNVPEAPYTGTQLPTKLPGINSGLTPSPLTIGTTRRSK